eukprot:TRINITY_DN3008_c0_g2_i1.p1 TRINITY_DN3008_c0_g2~~TRINITY_DN3008_c0_g2_i1.p1  ORF type:complete len:186 (+),score=14.92 TRINITY_DN3008_c0_g2_i1:97-654(+)
MKSTIFRNTSQRNLSRSSSRQVVGEDASLTNFGNFLTEQNYHSTHLDLKGVFETDLKDEKFPLNLDRYLRILGDVLNSDDTCFESMDLSENRFDEACLIKEIGLALKSNSTLLYLDISNCGVNSLKELFTALKVNASLFTAVFSNNNLESHDSIEHRFIKTAFHLIKTYENYILVTVGYHMLPLM